MSISLSSAGKHIAVLPVTWLNLPPQFSEWFFVSYGHDLLHLCVSIPPVGPCEFNCNQNN